MGCVDSEPERVVSAPTRTPTNANNQRKSARRKINRLISDYTINDYEQVSLEQKKAGKKAYTCPICTLRFNRILACDSCRNCVCLSCYYMYEKKSRGAFQCAFCKSQTSMFRDYNQAAHSYFDTTGNNGFISPEQRKAIDQQLKIHKQNQIVPQSMEVMQN